MPARAQDLQGRPASPGGQSPISDGLSWLVARAGVIFSGEVLPSEFTQPLPELPSIRLRVRHALRGVSAAEIFTFTQSPGGETVILAPHEQVILFLHPPNAAGLSSSAFGAFGVLRIGGGDLVDVLPLEMLCRQIASRTPLVRLPEGAQLSRNLRQPSKTIPEKQLMDTIQRLVSVEKMKGDAKDRVNEALPQNDRLLQPYAVDAP